MAAEEQRTGASTSPISQLEHKLEKLGVLLDLSEYRKNSQASTAQKETFANLCGLYAIHRKNLDVKTYGQMLVDRYNAPQMQEALDLYLEGMERGAQANAMPRENAVSRSRSAPRPTAEHEPGGIYALLEKIYTVLFGMYEPVKPEIAAAHL